MDEITLVNLLDKICEINHGLKWKLNCQFDDGKGQSVMQVHLLRSNNRIETARIAFNMETGGVLYGRHAGMVAFDHADHLTDVLLDIMLYEKNKCQLSVN